MTHMQVGWLYFTRRCRRLSKKMKKRWIKGKHHNESHCLRLTHANFVCTWRKHRGRLLYSLFIQWLTECCAMYDYEVEILPETLEIWSFFHGFRTRHLNCTLSECVQWLFIYSFYRYVFHYKCGKVLWFSCPFHFGNHSFRSLWMCVHAKQNVEKYISCIDYSHYI